MQAFGLHPWAIALQTVSPVWFGILWCAQHGRGDVRLQPCASRWFWREESVKIVNGFILTLQPPGCNCPGPVFFSFPWGFNSSAIEPWFYEYWSPPAWAGNGKCYGVVFFFFLCALSVTWDYTEGIDLIIKDPVFKPFLNFCSLLTQARIQLTSLSSASAKKQIKDLASGLMSYSISFHFNSSFYQVRKLH